MQTKAMYSELIRQGRRNMREIQVDYDNNNNFSINHNIK